MSDNGGQPWRGKDASRAIKPGPQGLYPRPRPDKQPGRPAHGDMGLRTDCLPKGRKPQFLTKTRALVQPTAIHVPPAAMTTTAPMKR